MNEWVNLVHGWGTHTKPLPQKHSSNWLTFSTMCCCYCCYCCWISIVPVDFCRFFFIHSMFLSCADVARRALSTLLVCLVASRFGQKSRNSALPFNRRTQANWSCVALLCCPFVCFCYCYYYHFSFNFNTIPVCAIAQHARAVCMAFIFINDATMRYFATHHCMLTCEFRSIENFVSQKCADVQLRIEVDADRG